MCLQSQTIPWSARGSLLGMTSRPGLEQYVRKCSLFLFTVFTVENEVFIYKEKMLRSSQEGNNSQWERKGELFLWCFWHRTKRVWGGYSYSEFLLLLLSLANVKQTFLCSFGRKKLLFWLARITHATSLGSIDCGLFVLSKIIMIPYGWDLNRLKAQQSFKRCVQENIWCSISVLSI